MTITTFEPTERLLTRHQSDGDRSSFSDHCANYGPLRIRTDKAWIDAIGTAVADAGLIGKGGAGFPAATKWSTVQTTRHRPVLVVNAMEGEPASSKDRTLLCRNPHLVLDGAEVVAAIVQASEVAICIPDHSDRAADSIERAIAERLKNGLSTVSMSVHRPPGRYVTGEESALVGWLNGRSALPQLRMDKSAPLKMAGRPIVVHNAETLSHAALIARFGSEWFRQIGTTEAPGSTLVTITGVVDRPGVFEVELGTSVLDVIRQAGCESWLSGALIGGYGGAWLAPTKLLTPYAPVLLAKAGATMGVGVIVALDTASCGITETARIVRFMAEQSAGQCGPCVFGLPALANDLELLSAGRGDSDILSRLLDRAAIIDGRGACRHPDGVVRLVRSALTVFADDVADHAAGRPCAHHTARSVMTFPINRYEGI